MLTHATGRDPRTGATDTDDGGFTLVELLISMSLLLIVGVIGTTFLVAAKNTADRSGSEARMAGRVRVAMSSVIHLLQLTDSSGAAGATSARFDMTTAQEVVFYTNENGNRVGTDPRTAPMKVDLKFTGTTLTQKTYLPTSTGTYPASPTTSTILLGDDSVPLGVGSGFTYCTGAVPTAAGGCTATADQTQISSVGVTMVVTAAGRAVQTFSSSAAMPGGSS